MSHYVRNRLHVWSSKEVQIDTANLQKYPQKSLSLGRPLIYRVEFQNNIALIQEEAPGDIFHHLGLFVSLRWEGWGCNMLHSKPFTNTFFKIHIIFQLCNHTSPGTQMLWFPGSFLPSLQRKRRQIASWHRLWLELGRYLIAFEPLTFVLD